MTNAIAKSHVAHLGFVPGTSRTTRSTRTLALQMAHAEFEHQREIGQRIKELRGRVPQPVIAEQVGVTLRAYQAWEAGGGIAWDNLVKLAEVFGVSEDYLEYGTGGNYRPGTDMARIERKLDALLRHAKIDPATFDADDGVADIVAAAKGPMEVLGGVAPATPRAKRVPARKRRAS